MFHHSRKQELKKHGEAVSVPNDDFSRLSYYLNCATIAVGIDILPRDLVDFMHARSLSKERKDEILRYAYSVLNPDTVVDKVFFRDRDGLCGTGHSNELFTVSQVDSILAIDTSFAILGQSTEVTKIMVFKDSWMEKNYRTPIRRQKRRIKKLGLTQQDPSKQVADALAAALLLAATLEDSDDEDSTNHWEHSNHCEHCRGLDDECGCSHGCAIKPETRCSKIRHCQHCKGFPGPCKCADGCTENIFSKCHVEHTAVRCDGCSSSNIQGQLFKCLVCDDLNFCQGCYDQGARKHDMTHGFFKITHVNADPVYLPPRQSSSNQSSQAQGSGRTHCSHCEGLEGPCYCTHGCAEGTFSQCYATYTDVTCDGCSSTSIRGQLFKCLVCDNVDLCQACYDQGARKHDMTHAVFKISRVNADPVYLPPRQPSNKQSSEAEAEDSDRIHCDHCKGLEGPCHCIHGCAEGTSSKCYAEHAQVTCDGCSSTNIRGQRFKCSVCDNFDLCQGCYDQGAGKHDMTHAFFKIPRVNSEPVYVPPRQSSSDQSSQVQYSARTHCDHCSGLEGPCHCIHGCAEGTSSKCYAEHTEVTCDGCSFANIRGERFKCSVCDNFDLCQGCYDQGARKHDMTHAFCKISRVNADPVDLPPRQSPPSPSKEEQPDVVVEVSSSPSPSIPVASPVVSGTGSGDIAVGDRVRLVGLNTESMNGVSAVVERDAPVPGGRLQVRLTECEPGKVLLGVTVKTENLEKVQNFRNGQVVVLKGLTDKSMNGLQGMVVSDCGVIVHVQLYEGYAVSIKPENMEIIADCID